jgi:myo-inositol-1(or 4)-monophosphatase
VKKGQNLTEEFREKAFQCALRAAMASGIVLNRYFWGRSSNFKSYKGPNDLVTTADLESCRVIRTQLKRDFPSHSFLFEEPEFREENDPDFLWIIDPLDGTTFHNRGLPYFSILLALQVRGVTEFGLAFTPRNSDLFFVWRGKGGFHRNSRFRICKPLAVSQTRKLDEAVIGYSYGKSSSRMKAMAEVLRRLLPRCRALTRVGGADIGFVAAGNCDAFIDNSSSPWDFAVFALMVREAGGRVTDLSGKEWNLNSVNIVVSNRLLHSGILRLLSGLEARS